MAQKRPNNGSLRTGQGMQLPLVSGDYVIHSAEELTTLTGLLRTALLSVERLLPSVQEAVPFVLDTPETAVRSALELSGMVIHILNMCVLVRTSIRTSQSLQKILEDDPSTADLWDEGVNLANACLVLLMY